MDLEVHHIKGAAKEPLLANDIDNVITLCSDCHKKVHAEEGCHYSDYKRPKCNPKRKGNTI
ncbi:MAG: HNH endonuclease [archaeon]|nr:HNH endonuclease [archaeon]